MDIPKSVRIMGKTYTLTQVPADEIDGSYGDCSSSNCRIRVAREQHCDQKRDTVLHEVTHAIDHELAAGLRERQVRLIATGLLVVLRDNPKLTGYMLDKTSL